MKHAFKRRAALVALVVLVASATLVYAMQNFWPCAQTTGSDTCWVSGTRG